jgi:hypothetical protein
MDLRPDIVAFLRKRGLWKKWVKTGKLFETDPSHPSLNTELLEPKHRLIYSFRIDLKHRALFICHWAEESRQRWDAYKSGRIPSVSYHEVMDKYRRS